MSTLMNALTSSYQEEEGESSRSSSPDSSIFNGEEYQRANEVSIKFHNHNDFYGSRSHILQARSDWELSVSDVSTSQSTFDSSATPCSSESLLNSSYLMSSQTCNTQSQDEDQVNLSQDQLDHTLAGSNQDLWAYEAFNSPLNVQAAVQLANSLLQNDTGSVNPSKVWKAQREEKDASHMLGQFEQPPPPLPINFHGDSVYSMENDYMSVNEVYSQESRSNNEPPPMARSRLDDARPVGSTHEGDMPSYMLSGAFRPETATTEQLQSMGYSSYWTDTRGENNDRNGLQGGRAFYEIIGGNKKRKVNPQVKMENSYPRVKMEDEEVDELLSEPEDESSLSRNMLPPPPPRSLVGKTDRAKNACILCHRRKTKCTEERPTCAHCRQVGADCEYPKEIRRRGKGKKKDRNGSICTDQNYSMTPLPRRLSSVDLASDLAVAAITSSTSSAASASTSSSLSSNKRRKSDRGYP